jgi:hypothetical protein
MHRPISYSGKDARHPPEYPQRKISTLMALLRYRLKLFSSHSPTAQREDAAKFALNGAGAVKRRNAEKTYAKRT